MDKEEYINLVNDKISNFKTKEIMIRQIDNFVKKQKERSKKNDKRI